MFREHSGDTKSNFLLAHPQFSQGVVLPLNNFLEKLAMNVSRPGVGEQGGFWVGGTDPCPMSVQSTELSEPSHLLSERKYCLFELEFLQILGRNEQTFHVPVCSSSWTHDLEHCQAPGWLEFLWCPLSLAVLWTLVGSRKVRNHICELRFPKSAISVS